MVESGEQAPAGRPRGGRPSPWRSFLWSVALLIFVATSAFFAGAAAVSEHALEGELEARARSLFNALMLTREWNERHGGVLVEKRPGVEASPFAGGRELEVDGKTWVPRYHAEMVREISDIAAAHGQFRFRISSLTPINSVNAPDAFERIALERFQAGDTQVVVREDRGGVAWYRFAAPLRVEPSCVTCHAGERVGGLRGAMSVSFPMADAQGAISRVRWIMAVLWGLTLATLLAAGWSLASLLQRRLGEAEGRIRELAATDEVTGLRNRRFALERLREEVERSHRYRRPLACILFDVDHFKRVNDTLGHAAGDVVLEAVGRAVSGECRSIDVVARYGGDEFLILLPETDGGAASGLAERLRRAVGTLAVMHGGRALGVTASFGVSSLDGSGDESPEEAEALLRRADQALYSAKRQGRNAVAMG
jgi:diguanylate cyclase (GGDEF)-like protein